MTHTDKQIAQAIARISGTSVSKLGLRFDRVVVRVLGDVRRVAEAATPHGLSVILTLTAPIRVPAKTAAALERAVAELIQTGAVGHDWSGILYENHVRLRLVAHARTRTCPFIGFVHNADIDAVQLLGLAEDWLRAGA